MQCLLVQHASCTGPDIGSIKRCMQPVDHSLLVHEASVSHDISELHIMSCAFEQNKLAFSELPGQS